MKCTHCNQPVREAKWWEKLINPIAFISQLNNGTCYVHTSKPKRGYISTFPLTSISEVHDEVCSGYIFEQNPGIAQGE